MRRQAFAAANYQKGKQRMLYRVFHVLVVLVLLGTVTVAEADSDFPLRDAAECRARGGLPNVVAKLEAGGPVRIGYLGGSITAQPGWRPKSLGWFRAQYPKAEVSEINAAIGGTGSGLGVFRLDQDVLQYKPDLIFVEFAVNDGSTAPESIFRSVEGIVRKTWRANPETDICFVYTLTEGMLVDLQGGYFPRAASAMEVVADHYGIPSIHMGLEVARLEKEGTVVFKAPQPETDDAKAALAGRILFSPDGVHPYPEGGHDLYLDAITRSIPAIQAAGKPGPHGIAEPIMADNWENATLVPLDRANLSAGWQQLDPKADDLAKRFGNRLPKLWRATAPGEGITFKFKGTYAAIYDLVGPDCGQVIVEVDGGEPSTRPRFDAHCTYHRLSSLGVASDLPDVEHTVTVTVHPEQPDKAKILSQRNQKIDDPTRFDGTTWYAGGIMVLGEMVE